MNVAVVGTGYVGLVTSACLAKLGHRVWGFDSNLEKIRVLKSGKCPIYEPGLEPLLKDMMKRGRLTFVERIADAVRPAQIIFIAVGTPPGPEGATDVTAVERVARDVAEAMTEYKLLVGKSTVPVKTGEWIKRTVERYQGRGLPFDVASNPEFLREGTAIGDFMKPDRIVIGVESVKAKDLLLKLYRPIKAPVVVTNIETAELIKHACNSFLAMKVSYTNALAQLCEKTGARIEDVSRGMGLDPRIGKDFLKPGPGYGGYCLPKDIQAFTAVWEAQGVPADLLKAVADLNEAQKRHIASLVEKALWVVKGKTIAAWGLAFKTNTDDTRLSPAVDIVRRLMALGADLRAYDPQAMERAKEEVPSLVCAASPYEAVKQADALVILTEWEEFRKASWARVKSLMRTPVIIDARNLCDPEKMRKLGFSYTGIGRPGPETSLA